MGWRAEVEGLPVERDGVVYITPISRFVEADVQGGRFMPEQLELQPGLDILIYRVP